MVLRAGLCAKKELVASSHWRCWPGPSTAGAAWCLGGNGREAWQQPRGPVRSRWARRRRPRVTVRGRFQAARGAVADPIRLQRVPGPLTAPGLQRSRTSAAGCAGEPGPAFTLPLGLWGGDRLEMASCAGHGSGQLHLSVWAAPAPSSRSGSGFSCPAFASESPGLPIRPEPRLWAEALRHHRQVCLLSGGRGGAGGT